MNNNLFHSISIGGLVLKNNLIAAPMAGLSSLPYRLLAIEQGCALAFSEMVAAEGVIRAHARTKKYFVNDDAARPFGVQVFGANPGAIAEAIKIIDETPVDLFDINMGCPVKKVCSKGAGAALMRAPSIAAAIVKAARAAVKKPLTVKIRAGWDAESINCIEIARIAEENGADAIIIHPRTKAEMFRGRSNWKLIGDVKTEVRIPVIGNGDVKCRDDAIRMIKETGCEGVMIGRAAVGNPWIFGQMLNEDTEPPSPRERGESAARHFDHLCRVSGERTAILQMRTILPLYGKGLRGVKKFMQGVNRIKNADELKNAINLYFENFQSFSKASVSKFQSHS